MLQVVSVFKLLGRIIRVTQRFSSNNEQKLIHSNHSERTLVSTVLTAFLSSITWPHNTFWVFEHTTKTFPNCAQHTAPFSHCLTPCYFVRSCSLRLKNDAKTGWNQRCDTDGVWTIVEINSHYLPSTVWKYNSHLIFIARSINTGTNNSTVCSFYARFM
jgi:hypothetical protein